MVVISTLNFIKSIRSVLRCVEAFPFGAVLRHVLLSWTGVFESYFEFFLRMWSVSRKCIAVIAVRFPQHLQMRKLPSCCWIVFQSVSSFATNAFMWLKHPHYLSCGRETFGCKEMSVGNANVARIRKSIMEVSFLSTWTLEICRYHDHFTSPLHTAVSQSANLASLCSASQTFSQRCETGGDSPLPAWNIGWWLVQW